MADVPDDTPTSPQTPSAKRPAVGSVVGRRATPGTWLDTSAPLTRAQALEFLSRGFRGRFGYVPLPGNDTSRDVSGAEIAMLLDVGLEVGLVQHPRAANVLRLHSGGADAMAAAQWAASIGYPAGAHIFLDLEGVLDTSPGQVTTYCVDWARACLQLGYSAGLYVGYATVIGPQELYELPLFDCYWTDAVGRRVNVRGCAVKQRAQVPAAGGLPNYDPDDVAPDALGGLPLVAAVA